MDMLPFLHLHQKQHSLHPPEKRISVILTTQPYSPQIGKPKTMLLANIHLVHLKNRPLDLALLPMTKPKLMPDTQVQLVENN
jgi:hypothetical protein